MSYQTAGKRQEDYEIYDDPEEALQRIEALIQQNKK